MRVTVIKLKVAANKDFKVVIMIHLGKMNILLLPIHLIKPVIPFLDRFRATLLMFHKCSHF